MLKQTFVSAIMALTLILFSYSVNSQEKLDQSIIEDLNESPRMAIGAKNERHIKGGIKIYEQLIASGATIEHFEIVIWGKIVKEITENTELFQFIEEHTHKNLKLSVCEVAMERLEVTIDDLPKGMTTVPNAWVRMLQLQAQGYNTLVP